MKYERSTMNEYAPIILFVYNRLDKTKQVLEALAKNAESTFSDLYIYSDGAKNDEDEQKVKELREYLKSITGYKSITVTNRDRNYGLAKNIIDGVSNIVDKYGNIIVLEDDIVVGQYFLRFMNDALKKYKDNSEVMEITGYLEPVYTEDLPEAMFIKKGGCWGWATWSDRWELFSREKVKIYKSFNLKEKYLFDLDGVYGKSEQLFYNAIGILDTWAVYWDAAIFKNDGLVLVPAISLVKNIGADGSGEHMANPLLDKVTNSNSEIHVFPNELVENQLLRKRIKEYYKSISPDIVRRVWHKLVLLSLYVRNRDKLLKS